MIKDYYVGKQSTLTVKQEHFLKLHLRVKTYSISQEVAMYVMNRFGVKYTVTGITKLMHRLGFVYKKPKMVPGKADRVKQAEVLTIYQELKANKNPEDHIYFGDGCHPHHNPSPLMAG